MAACGFRAGSVWPYPPLRLLLSLSVSCLVIQPSKPEFPIQLKQACVCAYAPQRQYENKLMTGVRMDKWLWSARFFRTRALAVRACELGRIESNGRQAKASREVRAATSCGSGTTAAIFTWTS